MPIPGQRLLAVLLACPLAVQLSVAQNDSPPLPEGAVARFAALKGEWIKPLGFTADGQTLVLRTDSAILLGAVKTGTTRNFLRGRTRNAALSPDGKTLVTIGLERTNVSGQPYLDNHVFNRWDVLTGAKVFSASDFIDTYETFSLSPGGKYFAWSFKADVFVRKNSETAKVQKISGTRWVMAIAFSPDGDKLAVAYRKGGWPDYQIHVWHLPTMQQSALLTEPGEARAYAVSFSPDGRTLAVPGDGVIDLWDLKARKITRRFRHLAAVFTGCPPAIAWHTPL